MIFALQSYSFCSVYLFLLDPTGFRQPTSDILGSRFFPRVVAVLIGILSIFQLLSAVGELKKLKDVGVKEEKEAAKLNCPFLLTTVALFAYYLLVLGLAHGITSILYFFLKVLCS